MGARFRLDHPTERGPFAEFVWKGHLFAYDQHEGFMTTSDGRRFGRLWTAHCRACGWAVPEMGTLPPGRCTGEG